MLALNVDACFRCASAFRKEFCVQELRQPLEVKSGFFLTVSKETWTLVAQSQENAILHSAQKRMKSSKSEYSQLAPLIASLQDP